MSVKSALGTGFYALRIAKRIQPGGTYYANDLQPAMLARLERKVAAQKVTNIKTIVGTQTDPRLPRGTLDYVLMVDVYHELSQPQIILRNIAAALKPGGKLILIEALSGICHVRNPEWLPGQDANMQPSR